MEERAIPSLVPWRRVPILVCMKKAGWILLASTLVFSASLPIIADDALTLTVKGRRRFLREVAAAERDGPGEPFDKWLIIPIGPEGSRSRSDSRETDQMARDRLHAVGSLARRHGYGPVVSLRRDAVADRTHGTGAADDQPAPLRIWPDAEFRSKMVGQDRHFHANVKAAVSEGVAEIRRSRSRANRGFGGRPSGGRDKKVAPAIWAEYTQEMFRSAIADGNLDAVSSSSRSDVPQRARQGRGPPDDSRGRPLRQPIGEKPRPRSSGARRRRQRGR